MMISWHYPFNFVSPHTDSEGLDLTEGMSKECIFDYFFNPTTRLEDTATSNNFLHDDFDHCDILSTPVKDFASEQK
jgi:hypothetical protein